MTEKLIKVDEGLEHIHRIMHVFIEGLAAGVYDSVDDIQADAKEYLAMEKAVEKLSNWNKDSSVEDLSNIFDGLSRSMDRQRAKVEEEKVWSEISEMPVIGEDDVK